MTVGVPQRGALGGRLGLSQALALAALHQRRDHLRDHVARAGDHDLVALAHVLPRQVLLVVEGRGRDRDAAHAHRLERGEREERAGPPHVPEDVVELGRRGDRRELPGHRPARLAPDDAELAPQRPLVDLDHDAVDLEVQLLAAVLPPLAALDHLVGRLVDRGVRIHLESAVAQPVELLGVGRRARAHAERRAVAPDRQRPRRGDVGVELTQRASRRVARIGERRLSGGTTGLVQLRERRARQVDLPAHLDQARSVVDPQSGSP